ncbi:hypothetical protein MEQU1_001464 [Malassezia equina]|uniref:Gluconokinase n=1 Tax=Malassezia equina TaxID=1381935 RepID=A0AAF0EI69_9BASI|nr:hypothetical protein MEQU1_001464 [Malassezia equina]
MAHGLPLTDADRGPWLVRVRDAVDALCQRGQADLVVVACSALRRAYRDVLRDTQRASVQFVYLAVEPPVLEERLAARQGHFMQASLLSSQLATLEPPDEEPGVLTIPVQRHTTLKQVLQSIQMWMYKTT